MACKAGLIEAVREMIKLRVKTGVKDKDGMSALQVKKLYEILITIK